MCTWIYAYACMYTYKCMCACVWVYVYVYMYIYVCMYIYICVGVCICAYMYMRTCAHTRGKRQEMGLRKWGRTYLGDERESMGHIYVCTCAHVWTHVHTHVAISICLSACLSTCLLVCLFIRLYRGVISVPMLSFSTNSRHSHDHAVSSRWGCVGSRMRRGCRFRKPYRLCILMSDAT